MFNRAALAQYFSFYIKQKGALLSKGRLLGLQFLTLFQNDLYNELGRVAWEKVDAEHTAIRLITSWATEDNQVEALLKAIEQLS